MGEQISPHARSNPVRGPDGAAIWDVEWLCLDRMAPQNLGLNQSFIWRLGSASLHRQ